MSAANIPVLAARDKRIASARRLLVGALCSLCAGFAFAAGPAALFAAQLKGLDGKPVALERYKGRPLIVNFWARWCGPCRVEIPELAKVHEAHGKEVVVLGIGVEEDDESLESVRDFVKAYEMKYPVLIGDNRKTLWLMQVLGNKRGGLPFTAVIDARGEVVEHKLGAMSAVELKAAVAQLMARANPETANSKP